MPVMSVYKERVPVKAWTDQIESNAIQQLKNCASMPFIHKHVAVMPDVHYGMGATVGSVIPTKGAIIPSSVGVDIGCGMCAVRTTLTSHQLPETLKPLRETIEKVVPIGFSDHGNDAPKKSERAWLAMQKDYQQIEEKHPQIKGKRHPLQQVGTLGGGNHFIEICLDEADSVWIMLHSGSRGTGNRIGSYFISKAKEEMERMFIHLPDQNLAYFAEGSELFYEYVNAVHWAQEYAKVNRDVMMDQILSIMGSHFTDFDITDEAINCHHNYVEKENHFGSNVWVTRKGAVRAREGDLGIIPGSMGAKSFIVRGKGNPESFHSCSHGAGRKMSRSAAKKQFTVQDHEIATMGVECRKDDGVLDETPSAYKDIDEVMANQSDLVDVVHTLKQIVCVKG